MCKQEPKSFTFLTRGCHRSFVLLGRVLLRPLCRLNLNCEQVHLCVEELCGACGASDHVCQSGRQLQACVVRRGTAISRSRAALGRRDGGICGCGLVSGRRLRALLVRLLDLLFVWAPSETRFSSDRSPSTTPPPCSNRSWSPPSEFSFEYSQSHPGRSGESLQGRASFVSLAWPNPPQL